MRRFDYHTVIDHTYLDRIVKEGFFERLYGPGIKAEIERNPGSSTVKRVLILRAPPAHSRPADAKVAV